MKTVRIVLVVESVIASDPPPSNELTHAPSRGVAHLSVTRTDPPLV